MENYEYYVDENNLHCVVGTTYSFDGYSDMVDGMQRMEDSCIIGGTAEISFTEVAVPDPIDYNALCW